MARTANYTVNPAVDRPGTLFTTRGALGAVTFTLPQASRALTGWWYDFLGLADQTVTIAAATADTLAVLHDLAADSLAASTGNQKIGARLHAECDGVQWIVTGAAVGVTYTVAS